MKSALFLLALIIVALTVQACVFGDRERHSGAANHTTIMDNRAATQTANGNSTQLNQSTLTDSPNSNGGGNAKF